MDEDSQISSSPSILIPESPESSHSSPENPSQGFSRHLSATYTPLVDIEENAQVAIITERDIREVNFLAVWHPGIVYDSSNSVNENSNATQSSSQSEPVLFPQPIEDVWGPVPMHDDSSRQSAATDPVTSEESNSCDKPARNDEEEPPAKVRKLDNSLQEEGDADGATCPICLEWWGSSGAHRLVALRCGHLFGAQCVRRWLRGQAARDRCCPTCKARASLRDVRALYARRLLAADTALVTSLQRQLEVLQREKNQTQLELHKSKIAHRACMLQLEDLRKTLLKTQVKEQPVRKSWRFALEKNLEVTKDGGCRVMTYNCRTYELYVSQKSTNNLFPGYGIRKVSCVDYKLGQFLHLHPKPIRDITYSQPRDLLLSVGLDNTARIVERGILSSTIQCGQPLWACTWDYLRSNEFYVGGTGGMIQQYDIRNSARYIEKFNTSEDLTPVVSLVSTEHGLLSCQLNSCWLWTRNLRHWDKRSVPVEGSFMSMCYDNDSHRVLVSSRAGVERAKLYVCKVKSGHADVSVECEQVFSGSSRTSVMCRSAFVRAAGCAWAAAHSESEAALELHALDGGRGVRLPAAEPAVAVCAAQINDTVVAALSEARLRLYRALPTT